MRPDAHTLVAAYAVDALDEHERADVRAHLDECEACREDLRSYRDTVALLASATAEAPPARMREQVLARARQTPQLPPVPQPGGPPDDGAPAATPRRGSGRALFALAASVLTVVALGAGAFGVVQSQRLGDVRDQQAAVERVLSADDVITASGVPTLTDGVQGDRVVVLASTSEDAALLLPGGLPTAPEGSTWQAWTVTGDTPVSAGVFDVGSGEPVVLDASVAGVDAVAVTLEPEGGSEAPSTEPVLVVPVV